MFGSGVSSGGSGGGGGSEFPLFDDTNWGGGAKRTTIPTLTFGDTETEGTVTIGTSDNGGIGWMEFLLPGWDGGCYFGGISANNRFRVEVSGSVTGVEFGTTPYVGNNSIYHAGNLPTNLGLIRDLNLAGQAGKFLKVNAGANGFEFGDAGGSGGPIMGYTRPFQTGYLLLGDTLNFGAGSTAPTVNNIILIPFSRKVTIDALVFEVTTAGAVGTQAYIGIYDSDPVTGRPTTLIHQSAALAVASTGQKTYALPADLPIDTPKWIAFIVGGSLCQLRAGSNNGEGARIFGLFSLSANPPTSIKVAAGAFGPLPADFAATYPTAEVSYDPPNLAARIA